MMELDFEQVGSRFGRSIFLRIPVQNFLIKEVFPEPALNVIAAGGFFLDWSLEVISCLSFHLCLRCASQVLDLIESGWGLRTCAYFIFH